MKYWNSRFLHNFWVFRFSVQNFSAWRKFMSKIGQNNFKSNQGWNIPKIVDLMISSFLCLTNNFDLWFLSIHVTNQKMKFSIRDFFSKCDQIRSFLWIWSHLLKKFLMKIFILCAVSWKHNWLAISPCSN